MGVACVVVRDLVTSNSALVESTVDWYAQDRQGNVWYFGEDTKEYTNGAVSSTQGTWEAGVDGALPGIYMKAHPKPGGPAYLQEYRPGVAVDMAKILRVDKTLKVPSGTYRTVVETYDTDPLHPSKREHKSPDLRRWRSCRAQPGRRLSHGRGGAIVAVTGPSGSGKSTLLYLLGGLEDPDAGGGGCASRAPCGGRCGRGPSTVPAPHLRVHRPGIEPPAPGYRGRECRGGPPARRRGAGRAGPPGRRRPGPGGPGRRRREAHRPALRRPAAARRYRPRAHRRPRRRARRRAHGEPRLRQRPGRDPAACGTARERGSAVVLVTHDSEVARHADRVVHLHSGVLDAPAAGTPERAQ